MDLNKLKGKIVENGLNIPKVAEKLEIDPKTLYRRLNSGKITVGDAAKMKRILSMTDEEAIKIFLS